jgi:membrane complex biogenesis BtpA family protein
MELESSRARFNALFEHQTKPIIGVVHVLALPGTPAHTRELEEIIQIAGQEAAIYRDAGVDGVLIENMHDTPYLRGQVGPEIVASMTAVAIQVRSTVPDLPVGIQILASANREALAVAKAAGLAFIRAENMVFGHVADEGWVESCAGELLRYRRVIGAESVQIWADVKKKHSAHAVTADVSLADSVAAVDFFRGDAVVITGTATGHAPALEDVRAAQQASDIPVLLGSGITSGNLALFWDAADGFIVGSWFKERNRWSNPVNYARVSEMVARARELR